MHANEKYVSYLFDFIKTIKRLKEGTAMSNEFIEFLAEKESLINDFLIEISKARKELREKLKELSGLINLQGLNDVKQWYYREPSQELFDTLVHDIKINGVTIAIDTILSPSGWYFNIFQREKNET